MDELPIETIGHEWADWSLSDRGPRYDALPDRLPNGEIPRGGRPMGYSLGDSTLADKSGMAGVGKERDSGLRSAKGTATRSTRAVELDDASPWVSAFESGMAHLKLSNPVLWSVGVAYYLGEVPIGYRASAKLRRRRFRVDDGNGMVVARRERLSRIEGEGKAGWKRRVGRRLMMTWRTFDAKLVMFHERMRGWIEGSGASHKL